jgi:branched-subunit amino acid aminotransferase/4-amino-4-deoxychorismate lyase
VGQGDTLPPGDRGSLRVVVLNGVRVDPAHACLSIDDPAVRAAEGIIETMRAENGAVPFLGRHLDRLVASVAALEIDGMPDREAMERDVRAAVRAAGPGPLRVRLTATPAPTVLVDVTPARISQEALARGLSAISLRGWWVPENRLAEHKTLARVGFRRADRRAAAAGVNTALLLDRDGRLGEATTANVFAVVDGALVTPPVEGLLPGVTRAVVREIADVREAHLPESAWRSASEMFLTSGVSGAVPLTRVDGAPVGDGRPGPVATRIGAELHALMTTT